MLTDGRKSIVTASYLYSLLSEYYTIFLNTQLGLETNYDCEKIN